MKPVWAVWAALAAVAAAEETVETRHLTLRYAAEAVQIEAGAAVRLALLVELKPRMHVYAPEVEGSYIPVSWKLNESPLWRAGEVAWPPSRKLYLAAIEETVPVYEGSFRLERRLEFSPAASGEVMVEGIFRYQACDDKMCYRPETIPLRWSFRIGPTDRPGS